MLYAVILSGGSGTRFWPRSRTRTPKQLLPMVEGKSLLQLTVERIAPAIPGERVLVITNEAQGPETKRQLAGRLPERNIVLEPFGRDTAPCIGLAAALLRERDPEATMVVLPADHIIEPAERFNALIKRAGEQATAGRVVTLGARPRYAATGFGYIEKGAVLDAGDDPLYQVERFKEKPTRERAEEYRGSGRFLWNCGIFVWRAETVLNELERHKPLIYRGLETIVKAWGSDRAAAVLREQNEGFEKISIDYAVLEHCTSIAVLEIDFQWDDLGSWAAVEELYERDEQGHRVVDAEHVSVNSENCFVVGQGKLIATVGVKDLVIVQTDDATLICRRDEVQKVKAVVEELKRRGRRELLD